MLFFLMSMRYDWGLIVTMLLLFIAKQNAPESKRHACKLDSGYSSGQRCSSLVSVAATSVLSGPQTQSLMQKEWTCSLSYIGCCSDL